MSINLQQKPKRTTHYSPSDGNFYRQTESGEWLWFKTGQWVEAVCFDKTLVLDIAAVPEAATHVDDLGHYWVQGKTGWAVFKGGIDHAVRAEPTAEHWLFSLVGGDDFPFAGRKLDDKSPLERAAETVIEAYKLGRLADYMILDLESAMSEA